MFVVLCVYKTYRSPAHWELHVNCTRSKIYKDGVWTYQSYCVLRHGDLLNIGTTLIPFVINIIIIVIILCKSSNCRHLFPSYLF
jgi:hypothetical protein